MDPSSQVIGAPRGALATAPPAGPTCEFDVAVVGGGPVGLTAANLLAARGHSVVLFEKNPTTSNEPKAISLDDESLRIMQAPGLAAGILDIVVPGTGTVYYGRHGRELFHASSPEPYRLGYPFKNPFSQPELESVLLEALSARPTAEIHLGTTVLGLAQDSETVNLRVQGPAGRPVDYRAKWVLGCDGGRSTVRRSLDIGMTGRSFREPWLVIDATGDAHDEQHGLHYGDQRRPHVIVPGRDGRCRYEFLLHEGEARAGDKPSLELMQRLLAGYRTLDERDIERAVIYTFHALVADGWQDRRCLLLGDAAHMMPPFAGQGLNSGLRDAGNLCWKISEVLDGRLTPAAVATFESERRPHAEATVALSARLGSIVMTTNPLKAMTRDAAVRLALRTPWGRRYLTEMRYRPRLRVGSGLVAADAGLANRRLIGTTIAQPRVYDLSLRKVVLLDEALADGWGLIGVDLAGDGWASLARQQVPNRLRAKAIDVSLSGHLRRSEHGRTVLVDVDGGLHKTFRALRGRWLLVRPDRVIAAVGVPGQFAGLTDVGDRFLPPEPGALLVATAAASEHHPRPAPRLG